MPLLLASTSAIRSLMLDAAGVAHQTAKPDVDEDSVKSRLSDPKGIAAELAQLKALSVVSDQWVIGSDSVASVCARRFDKPRNREEAAEHLRFFSGRRMELTSAVALARSGELDWRHVDTAVLNVRELTEGFIQSYLNVEWPEVGYCAGVFRLEGRGVQLFESIEGDHFTILGMPLLPLLGALRERGLMPA